MHLIDLDAILETANLGVRRTAVFLGLGINAANDDALQDYQLTKLTQIQLVPSNASKEAVGEYKAEFARWLMACGLRELVETFSVFLDQMHAACLTFAVHQRQIPAEQEKEYGKAFVWKGLRDKLQLLESRFRITTTGAGYISDANKARNCFTHRRGIVGPEDCETSHSMTIRWPGMDLYIETPTGDTISLDPPFPEEGILVEGGGKVMLRRTERVRCFGLGEIVSFAPKDLAEICLLFNLASGEIMRECIAYAKSIGVPVVHREAVDQKGETVGPSEKGKESVGGG